MLRTLVYKIVGIYNFCSTQ